MVTFHNYVNDSYVKVIVHLFHIFVNFGKIDTRIRSDMELELGLERVPAANFRSFNAKTFRRRAAGNKTTKLIWTLHIQTRAARFILVRDTKT
jgi:hypothetical protein